MALRGYIRKVVMIPPTVLRDVRENLSEVYIGGYRVAFRKNKPLLLVKWRTESTFTVHMG